MQGLKAFILHSFTVVLLSYFSITILQKNTGLTSLNMSWNGLHMSGTTALGKALEKNSTLTELDISNNRIDRACLDRLCICLKRNSTLEILRVGVPLKCCARKCVKTRDLTK